MAVPTAEENRSWAAGVGLAAGLSLVESMVSSVVELSLIGSAFDNPAAGLSLFGPDLRVIRPRSLA